MAEYATSMIHTPFECNYHASHLEMTPHRQRLRSATQHGQCQRVHSTSVGVRGSGSSLHPTIALSDALMRFLFRLSSAGAMPSRNSGVPKQPSFHSCGTHTRNVSISNQSCVFRRRTTKDKGGKNAWLSLRHISRQALWDRTFSLCALLYTIAAQNGVAGWSSRASHSIWFSPTKFTACRPP